LFECVYSRHVILELEVSRTPGVLEANYVDHGLKGGNRWPLVRGMQITGFCGWTSMWQINRRERWQYGERANTWLEALSNLPSGLLVLFIERLSNWISRQAAPFPLGQRGSRSLAFLSRDCSKYTWI